MDKITHQVRVNQWKEIMQACLSSGMKKTAWCRANGISEKQLFYWQRILRKEAFAAQEGNLPALAKKELPDSVSFAEIKLPIPECQSQERFLPDVVIRQGSVTIEIANTASDQRLSRIGGMLSAK